MHVDTSPRPTLLINVEKAAKPLTGRKKQTAIPINKLYMI